MDGKLGFLGPRGTFSEEAALLYCRSYQRSLVEFSTIGEVIEAVASKELSEGIVPLENSLEGSVGITLDLLVSLDGIAIRHELVFPISHCLLARPGEQLERVHTVYSHPQALGQCRGFLRRRLAGAACLSVESTAAAAKLAAINEGSAAIAPCRAGAIYSLEPLAEKIEDSSNNATRFIVLAEEDHLPTGSDKTSMVLACPDGPGSLYTILGYFAHLGINLTRIESRPSRRNLGDYLFFIDCQGHRLDPVLLQLHSKLRSRLNFIKLLGSYPRA